MNSKYQNDIQERNSLIAELKERGKARNQQVTGAEAEIRELRERVLYEEQAVGHFKGIVANAEGIRAELVESNVGLSSVGRRNWPVWSNG